MPMIDIDAIARQYEAFGLTLPADLDLAVGYYAAAQEAVNTPADHMLTAST